ncbi:MAG: thiamine phosphate synthase [Rhodospirillaceae bacterium]|jgi:thiamine-phosphate pyrophosphorylase|nr:thiamine phosphate synthase [Rhodospirillaceae bacterium]
MLLYLITPPELNDLHTFTKTMIAVLDVGCIAYFQLRVKNLSDDSLCRIIDVLRPEVQKRDVAFILNDRHDLAFATGCDGVHIGQNDVTYDQARKIVGIKSIVGVTCYNSRSLATIASKSGADYVSFGAFYTTSTKKITHRSNPKILSWWSGQMKTPCVAIGGITLKNATPLIEAGADFLAISSGIWNYPDGAVYAIRCFKRLISNR